MNHRIDCDLDEDCTCTRHVREDLAQADEIRRETAWGSVDERQLAMFDANGGTAAKGTS